MACLLCLSQAAQAESRSAKTFTNERLAEIKSAEFSGVFNYENATFCVDMENNSFVIKAVCNVPISHAELWTTTATKWNGSVTWDSSSIGAMTVPDSCISGDSIVIRSAELENGYWDYGEAYWLVLSSSDAIGFSDTIYTDDYIGREILEYLYNKTGIEEAEEPRASSVVELGDMQVSVCSDQASLCDLSGRTVPMRREGDRVSFRVSRHGIYVLRYASGGCVETKKIRL